MLVWIYDTIARILSSIFALITFTSMCNAAMIPPTAVRSPDVMDYQAGLRAETQHHFGAAMALLKKAAKAGNSEAKFQIGKLYAKGWGVPLDYQVAMSWYRKAAAAGNAKAALRIGGMYEMGLGTKQNLGTAALWFAKSAMMGDRAGVKQLGSLCKNKEFSAKSRRRVLTTIHTSAVAGNTGAMLALASLYGDGRLVPMDSGRPQPLA